MNSPEKKQVDVPLRPSSPTDQMLSPCSKRLWKKNGGSNKLIKKIVGRPDFHLSTQLQPQPFPFEDIKLILGTSSSGRRTVVDRLGWKYEQMAADIDGA